MAKKTKRAFDHILIIMFENEYRSYVMKNPYFKKLSEQGINMENYFGVMHPSQTNYISSIAAELCNVTDDDAPQNLLPQRTIVDLIEEAGLDWRAYMDSYIPQNQGWSPGLKPKDEYPYVIKHNAFSSFENIVRDEKRWKKIQNEAALFSDVLNGTLPEYAWFTPNMWNDGHYLDGTLEGEPQPLERSPTLVDQAARWLEGFFTSLKFPGPDSHLPKNTLVVVTFDEADFEALYDTKQTKKYYYDGPNQIYTTLLGDMIKPGVETEGYNHYSLIRTIEKNFSLNDLGKNDKDANWFKFLWGKDFKWKAPENTPLKFKGSVATAALDNTLYAVYDTGGGNLSYNTWNGKAWSDAEDTGITGATGDLAMEAYGDTLKLVSVGSDNAMSLYTFKQKEGWSAAEKLGGSVNKVALKSFDEGKQLMLAFSSHKNGQLYSMVTLDTGQWLSAVKVQKFTSTADIELACLGTSIYLIFQDATTGLMQTCSYNTAEFNVVTLQTTKYNGPQSNTSINQWSPNVYPVRHFSTAAYPGTPGEDEPVIEPYKSKGPLSCATLDGVMHLTHNGSKNGALMTESFSIHGLMTPVNPISYNPAETATTNTGYGTLVQAGWSEQSAIKGASMSGYSAMTQWKDELVLIYSNGKNTFDMVRGGY